MTEQTDAAAEARGAQAVLAAVEGVLARWSTAMRHPASDPGYSGGAVYRDIERAARAAAVGGAR